MIERIDESKCTGCGICTEICSVDVLRMVDEKAIIKYPEDCTTCFECELQCPAGAVYVHPFREVVPDVIKY